MTQMKKAIKIDTYSRLGNNKNLLSSDEGRAKFAGKAHAELPDIIEAHQAWMLMLMRQEVVPQDRGVRILQALSAIDDDVIGQMIVNYDPRFPKPILQLERYLFDQVGEFASDVVLARTLPPPLYRMKARRAMLPLIENLLGLLDTLLAKSEKHRLAVMPGYTHLQHAQLMTFGHYLLGLYDALWRALGDLEIAYDATNLCDMGCGALAGVSIPIDRSLLADLLGFDGVLEHSNDCVAATDHAVNTVAAMTNIAIPLSRVANELDTWSCFEWNMVELDDSLAETSSLMPQKKNPCVFEEVRSMLAEVSACYNDVVCRMHNTSYGDTIEVQAACERVVPTMDGLGKIMDVFGQAINTLIIKPSIMRRHAQEGFSTVTELVSILYREAQIPPRISHAIIAQAVRQVWEEGQTASAINASLLNEAAYEITGTTLNLTDEEISAALNAERFITAHNSQGGVAPTEVKRMIEQRIPTLSQAVQRQRSRRERIKRARQQLVEMVTLGATVRMENG
jgi:argininosuccinate lyase